MFLDPLMMILSSLKMWREDLLKSAIQSSSQSCPMERRDSLVIAGYTRDLVAVEESSGDRFKYPVCDGLMMVLSGRIAAGPCFMRSSFLSKCRSWVRVKCLDAPVSAFIVGVEIEL